MSSQISQTAAAGEAGGLPCLSSNNCTETDLKPLSTQHRKAASALAWNVQAMAEKHGIERLGFLTLTFINPVHCPKQAQRMFRSLRDHVLGPRYGDWIRVLERHESGGIHYHLVIDVGADIRTGFDFEAIKRRDYTSASELLRAEWKFLRSAVKPYGFGRSELLPVKSTAEAIARYVGKYISKHMAVREERDKGVRLVECSRGARMATSKYNFVSDGSAAWRRKVGLFAEIASDLLGRDMRSFEALREELGPRWAYNHRAFICDLPDDDSVNDSAAVSVSEPSQRGPDTDTAGAPATATHARSSTNPRDEKDPRSARSSGGACGRAQNTPQKGANASVTANASTLRILHPCKTPSILQKKSIKSVALINQTAYNELSPDTKRDVDAAF